MPTPSPTPNPIAKSWLELPLSLEEFGFAAAPAMALLVELVEAVELALVDIVVMALEAVVGEEAAVLDAVADEEVADELVVELELEAVGRLT